MAYLNSLTNGIFTSLSFIATAGSLTSMDTAAELVTLFASEPVVIGNIRTFPEFGIPANIVNVPTYGQKTSGQVSGQSDMTALEFEINYVPSDFADTNKGNIAAKIGDGNLYPFQIAICNKLPTSRKQIATTGIGAGSTANVVFNFAGKFESFTIVPSLTDALVAKISISNATGMFGPTTYD